MREIRPGDVVWIPAGEKHWHGGAPTTGMTHLAMQEALDGQTADWMEPVTDAQYAREGGRVTYWSRREGKGALAPCPPSLNGGHAIGRAFARPVDFAHPAQRCVA